MLPRRGLWVEIADSKINEIVLPTHYSLTFFTSSIELEAFVCNNNDNLMKKNYPFPLQIIDNFVTK